MNEDDLTPPKRSYCSKETEITKTEVDSGKCCGQPKSPDITPDGSDTGDERGSEMTCCSVPEHKTDYLMWVCGFWVLVSYGVFVSGLDLGFDSAQIIAHTSFEMVNTMWWGVLLGALAVGLLGRIPNQMVMSVLGQPGSQKGVVRATMAGLLLDLCNHGILMVAMGLYRKGASLGQVMAFLIASPWNSFTLTLILVALIGIEFTLLFIAASMVIAWCSGLFFDYLVRKEFLPANPVKVEIEDDFDLKAEFKTLAKQADYSVSNLIKVFASGLKESQMVLRWVLFGIVLVSLIRAFVDVDQFGIWFGATISGLFLTLLVTTIIEVCSEGSSPIAADLVNRAGAPGNGFVFLMAGAATDYTEIMALKDTTSSWKIALFLPLVTVPQVLLIGWIMNGL